MRLLWLFLTLHAIVAWKQYEKSLVELEDVPVRFHIYSLIISHQE